MAIGKGVTAAQEDASAGGVSDDLTLPTPLALVALRARRAADVDAKERFDSLSFLSEALLKYVVLCLHSCMESLDRDSWSYWGYQLAHGDSLGVWERALAALETDGRRAGAAGWMREQLDWLAIRRSGRSTADWFDCCYEASEELWALVQGPEMTFQRTVRGLMSFLVALRNRTRGHGTWPATFYSNLNPRLDRLLANLLAHSEPCRGLLWWYERTAGQSVRRLLSGATPVHWEQLEGEEPTGLVLSDPEDTWRVQFSPLMSYEPSVDCCLFANGAWHSKDSTCEGVDYRGGPPGRLSLPVFRSLPAPRPKSETAARPSLVDEAGVTHDLPLLMAGYVQRPALEGELSKVLSDRMHRIITLHGMGGVGKTTLALRVCHELIRCRQCPFELVLWFSARDVDLLVEGPRSREMDVRDIQHIAENFCVMLGGDEHGRRALDVFADHLSDSSIPTLLVMDNFETLDDPVGVHDYLDNTVVLPHKVLITSRLHGFKGDWPVAVHGMEHDEAEQLLLMEARRLGCEPAMTGDAVRRIWEHTGGIPYAMKLAVGQLGRGVALQQVVDAALADEQILDALFMRSYRSLSPGGRRLFLVAGNLKGDVPVLPVRAVLAQSGFRFDEALDECERASLLEQVGVESSAVIRMPEVARKFARGQLPGVPDTLQIEKELETVRQARLGSGAGDVQQWARKLAQQIVRETVPENREELSKVLEALTGYDRALWRYVADVRERLGLPAELVREAYEMAAQHEPNDSDVWQAWSEFEKKQRQERRSIELLIRAAESDPKNIGLNSHAAWRIAHFLKLERVPVADRPIWTSAVQQNLEEQWDALEPDPLARLGWLYYVNNDVARAKECALRGLSMDSNHRHCLNILNRVREAEEEAETDSRHS